MPDRLVFRRDTTGTRTPVTTWRAFLDSRTIGEWRAPAGGWVEGEPRWLLYLRDWRSAARSYARIVRSRP